MPAPSSVTRMSRRPPPSVTTSMRLRAGVERVLDQFLHHARRALDHLAGGDAVDDGFGQLADGHRCPLRRIGLRRRVSLPLRPKARVARMRRAGLFRARQRVSLRSLLHERQGVAVGIGEERHPQIVIVHLGDQVRDVKATPRFSSSATASAMSAQRK